MDQCKRPDLSVKRMCELLSCSRSGYYRNRKQRHFERSELELRSQIQQIALQWPSYGYRRVTAELQRRSVNVNRKRVLRMMRADNLLCIRKKRFIRTTRSDHSFVVYPNLTAGIQLTGLDQLWVADITYIRLFAEFIFLAVILDAFSRRCIGWCLSRRIDTNLTLTALRMALNKRHPSAALIHHSDQGMQYAATEYVELLIANQIRISMSRRANPYDNALAESFMKTLKYEEVHLFEYQNLNDAHQRIGYFLEEVYNQKRLHSSLGYRPPCEFESDYITNRLDAF